MPRLKAEVIQDYINIGGHGRIIKPKITAHINVQEFSSRRRSNNFKQFLECYLGTGGSASQAD